MNGQNNLIESTNHLIRQYISSYKYYQALACNDRDEQFEKDFRVQIDRIITAIVRFIESYDIDSLIEIWEFFNTKLFNNLDEHELKTANKLESDLFKLYLANAVQNKQLQKCTYFYERMSPIITNNSHWPDSWFCIPYLPDPANDDKFKNYFSKHWHELLLVSLHNFIACRIDRLCKPPLIGWNIESNDNSASLRTNNQLNLRNSVTNTLMDDFAVIAQRTSIKPTQSKSSLKNVLRNITGRRASSRSED